MLQMDCVTMHVTGIERHATHGRCHTDIGTPVHSALEVLLCNLLAVLSGSFVLFQAGQVFILDLRCHRQDRLTAGEGGL